MLGATGMVGQKYVSMLSNHPFFKLSTLTGHASVGKMYGDAAHWIDQTPIPNEFVEMEIKPTDPKYIDADLVFSPLPSDVARVVEPAFVNADYPVISEASTHRMNKTIPLIVPEVNPDHLDMIEVQRKSNGHKGFIVTGPNCTAAGLVIVLKPLYEQFKIRKVIITTMQALSGAGYQGVPSLAIVDNVIPYIADEEEKIQEETLKILGRKENGVIKDAKLKISAMCNRVPTIDGHLETIYVESDIKLDTETVKEVLTSFRGVPQELGLPTAPDYPIIVHEESDRPQPRLDRLAGSVMGMSTVVGRIRQGADSKSMRLALLTHNTIRGAAGNAILTAELLVANGYIGK